MSGRPDRSSAAAVVVVLAVVASVDWIAYLALRAAGPAVCVPALGALSTLVLAFARLLGPRRGDDQ